MMLIADCLYAGVKACTEAKHPVNEEPYEVNLDNHGCLNGPKTGRLRVSNNVRALVWILLHLVSLLCPQGKLYILTNNDYIAFWSCKAS